MASFTREAYVTLCTNENYVAGAQVLAHSLKRSGTTRELVCLTASSLPQYIRAKLQLSFDSLVDVDLIDTADKDALALLGRPELGVTATKIACWTLVQYSKCVFLDADTLVKQNVDELFQRPELSAAPDIGWPDCFNSGVFVYVPSMSTFKSLCDCLAKTGSFDGGDQGLLNEFFSTWSTSGAEHRLPFTYNMTANAAYGYAPAYERFRKDIKIVHFIGSTKPWHGIAAHSRAGANRVEQLNQDWHDMHNNFTSMTLDRYGPSDSNDAFAYRQSQHVPAYMRETTQHNNTTVSYSFDIIQGLIDNQVQQESEEQPQPQQPPPTQQPPQQTQITTPKTKVLSPGGSGETETDTPSTKAKAKTKVAKK